jgi:hypothetical protein
MTRLMLTLICIFTLGGCAIGSLENRENYMGAYVGKSADELVKVLGYSDGTTLAPNGNIVHIYSASSLSTSAVNCTENKNGAGSSCTGGNTTKEWCKDYFEVNKSKKVTNYSYKGNSCRTCVDDVVLCL